MNGTLLLVKKNWIYLTTSIKSALLSTLILCLFMPMCSLGFGIAIPALTGYILTYSIMAYEERSKVELMTAAMPVSRKEMCSAKYIESLIYLVGGCMVAQVGIWTYLLTNEHLLPREILSMMPVIISTTFFAGAIYNSVILPVIFYFGTIKARYYLMFSYILIFIGANIIGGMGPVDERMIDLINRLGQVMPLIMSGLGIVVYYISYRISCHIWEKKDFS